jgi:hypothetical protein
VPEAIESTCDFLSARKLKLKVSEENLEYIANKVAYKKITIKDAQKYILNKFKIKYEDKVLEDLNLLTDIFPNNGNTISVKENFG